MQIIDPAKLSEVVASYLEEYGDQVIEANNEAIRAVAKDVTKDLKKAGDFGGTGAYRKALKAEIKQTRISVSATIGAQAPHYRLTHLLEFGHATANGGRTKAFNFVKPINDTVEQRYIAEMERLLQ